MFTRDSERLRLTLGTLGLAVALYLVTVLGLGAITSRVEATSEIYPYKSEDWLRYLVPTLWRDRGKPLMLLTGPSTARENFLVGEFAAAFADSRVRQGAFSVATLSDVVVSLEYVERTYGAAAVPREIVLGLSPRFLAELPAYRPFAEGLAFYSQGYQLPAERGNVTLVEKPPAHGAYDRLRFLALKQGPRYQTALAQVTAAALGPALDAPITASAAARRLATSWPDRDSWVAGVAEVGPHAFLMEVVSALRYPRLRPMSAQMLERRLDDASSWWHDVYTWKPEANAEAVRARAAVLESFVARHGIALHLVNMPEHGLSRLRYTPGGSARYAALLHAAFPGRRILDLRCFLADAEFNDAEHASPRAARRETAQVVAFVKASRAARLAPGDAAPPALDSMATAHACRDLP